MAIHPIGGFVSLSSSSSGSGSLILAPGYAGTGSDGNADATTWPGIKGANLPGGINLTNHVFDDFNYANVAAIGSSGRPDGGPAWNVDSAGTTTISTSNLDPWGIGVKRVTFDYSSAAGSTISRALNGSGAPSSWHINTPVGDSIIIQRAEKHTGSSGKLFLGKDMESGNISYGGGNVRITDETYSDASGLFGESGQVGGCDNDTLVCNKMFSGNGTSPRYPADDPPGDTGDWSHLCFSDDNSQILGALRWWWWKQNMGASVESVGTNAANYQDDTWRIHTTRWTKCTSTINKRGRVEKWMTTWNGSSGVTTKVMEFFGDVGERYESGVFTWPSDLAWPEFWGPYAYSQAGWVNASCFVDLGWYWVGSHDRIAA